MAWLPKIALFWLLSVAVESAVGWTVESRQPAFQFQQSVSAEITPLAKATKAWRLCTLYPHIKDSYWLSVNFGMVSQARSLGVELRVAEAGGYHQLERQWQQLQACIDWQADAILLGTVSFDQINRRYTAAGYRVPLFGLVNNLAEQGVVARVGVPWYRMGYRAGAYLARRHPAGKSKATIAWFPGPQQRGGTPESGTGLRDALAGSAVELVVTANGDNDRNVQRTLLQQVLEQYPDIDYLVGSAVLAEVAVNELRNRNMSGPPQIVSHYLGHGVWRGLRRDRILMANSDQMVLQGRLAVDQAVRYLEGLPFLRDIGPAIIELTAERMDDSRVMNHSLSPAGFSPVYRVAPNH